MFNPHVTNGISHPYHLDESIFVLSSSIRSNSSFFNENHVSKQKSSRLDTTFAASHLGLFCLAVSHKKDARLIWVKVVLSFIVKCLLVYVLNMFALKL